MKLCLFLLSSSVVTKMSFIQISLTLIYAVFFSSTEPCTPTNVSSQLFCSAGIAQVSWAPSVNALSYAVKATSNGQILNCTSSSTNCTLSNLACGQAYDVQVSASDGTCVSNYSAPFIQDKGTDREVEPHFIRPIMRLLRLTITLICKSSLVIQLC